jgi:hypothetical protein
MPSICSAKPSPASFLAASTTLPNSINPASLVATGRLYLVRYAADRETPNRLPIWPIATRGPLPLDQFEPTFDRSGT